MLLVPLGNNRASLGSLRVIGSDIHMQASTTFVLTEVSSRNKQLRRVEDVRKQTCAPVPALKPTHGWLFHRCSSFLDRLVGYCRVIA